MKLGFLVYALFVVFLGLCFQPSHAESIRSLEQDVGIARDKIDFAQEDIANYKKEIERLEKRAARYEKMATDAQKQADESKHKSDKKNWRESAENRLNLAKVLRADIQKLESKIKEKEKEVVDLSSGKDNATDNLKAEKKRIKDDDEELKKAAEQQNDPSKKARRYTMDILLQLWEADPRNKGLGYDAGVFAITQKNPDFEEYKTALLLHTENRKWEGSYHSEKEIDAEGIASFMYKPKPEEMNEDIPLWARKQIEGELKWKMVLQQDGTFGTQRLRVEYYPGEVEWNEDDKTAKVIGKGKKREFLYSPYTPPLVAHTYEAPEVNIRLPIAQRMAKPLDDENKGKKKGKKKPIVIDYDDDEIDYLREETREIKGLMKRQQFFIDVFLPPEMAREVGESLMVSIKASSGDNTQIKLKAGRKDPKTKLTTYTHYSPVAIADRGDTKVEDYKPMAGSINWVMGKVVGAFKGTKDYNPGTRLPLETDNADVITFSYQDASYTTHIYNTKYQRGIARHIEAAQKLYGFFRLVGKFPYTSEFAKKEAKIRLQMLDNYMAIINNENVHDRIRFVVGEKYFGPADIEEAQFEIEMLRPGYDWKKSTAQTKLPGLLGQSSWKMKSRAETGGLNYWEKYGYAVDRSVASQKKSGLQDKKEYFTGVKWTHMLERAIIEIAAYNEAEEVIQETIDEIPLAMSYAIYTGITSATNADALHTVIFGENVMGQKVQTWERVNAYAGFGFGLVVSLGMPMLEIEMPNMKGFSLRSPKKVKKLAAQQKKREVQLLKDADARKAKAAKEVLNGIPDELLVSMPAYKPLDTDLAFNSWNKPMGCAKTKNMKSARAKKEIEQYGGSVIPYRFRDPGPEVWVTPRTKNALNTAATKNADPAPVNAPRNAKPDGSSPPAHPGEFKPKAVDLFEGIDAAPDVTLKSLTEAQRFYPEMIAIGPQHALPQQFDLCNCMFAKPDIEKFLQTSLSESQLNAMVQKLGKADAPLMMNDGVPTQALVALLEDLSFKTVIYREGKHAELPMDMYAHFLEEGMVIRGTVRPKGQIGEQFDHSVRLRRFGRNANGDIETVMFFDSAFGRNIVMKVDDYMKIVRPEHGLVMFHPTKDVNLVDLQMAYHKKINKGSNAPIYDARDSTPGLSDTWHDGRVAANDNRASGKSLDETWRDGELEVPRLANDNLEDTQVFDVFEEPQYRTDPKGRKVGTSEDSSAATKTDKDHQTGKGVSPPNPPNAEEDKK